MRLLFLPNCDVCTYVSIVHVCFSPCVFSVCAMHIIFHCTHIFNRPQRMLCSYMYLCTRVPTCMSHKHTHTHANIARYDTHTSNIEHFHRGIRLHVYIPVSFDTYTTHILTVTLQMWEPSCSVSVHRHTWYEKAF